MNPGEKALGGSRMWGPPRGAMGGLRQSMKFEHTRDLAKVLETRMITGDFETRGDLGILSVT
jgi:hypothetical protein